jgi:hypothetical protein
MAGILRSGSTATGPGGARSHLDEDVKYQRVSVDEMKISSFEDDLEPEQHKRDNHGASRWPIHHLKSLRQNKPRIYIMVFGGIAVLLVSYWAVV